MASAGKAGIHLAADWPPPRPHQRATTGPPPGHHRATTGPPPGHPGRQPPRRRGDRTGAGPSEPSRSPSGSPPMTWPPAAAALTSGARLGRLTSSPPQPRRWLQLWPRRCSCAPGPPRPGAKVAARGPRRLHRPWRPARRASGRLRLIGHVRGREAGQVIWRRAVLPKEHDRIAATAAGVPLGSPPPDEGRRGVGAASAGGEAAYRGRPGQILPCGGPGTTYTTCSRLKRT
jgi:hypothetical protein